jgi:predicted RNA binding protein YcfA (HicA-like mRNA interferase family)
MTRLPVVKPKEVIAALKKAGYVVQRQKGSHVHLRHPQRPGLVTIPFHNRDLLPNTLKTIIEKQAGMSVSEFVKLLAK